MNPLNNNRQMITRLFFRLLPVQILLASIGAVNGIVSGLFASNSIGPEAMSAITLYAPINQFLVAMGIMLLGGSQVLCGQYMGKNQLSRTQDIFSADMLASLTLAVTVTAALALAALTGLTGAMAPDAAVREQLNAYMLGQAIGVIPLLLSQQLSGFLSLEQQTRRTTVASLVYIGLNIAFNFLFVSVLRLQAFGLALASSLGLWVFLAIQGQYFLSPRALLRLRLRGARLRDVGEMIRVGFPGALSQGYQVIRRVIVNGLLTAHVGSVGLSAFGVSDTLLGLVWGIPFGIAAVGRMLISVSVGEEDRQTLTDVMRVILYRCVPMMCLISAAIILCAEPLTGLYVRDRASDLFRLAANGFRILPLCMPFSVVLLNFVTYGQASGKQLLVQVESLLDGVVCVAGFTALLIPALGMNSVYVANVLNGVVTVLFLPLYAWIVRRRFPRTMDELMCVPDSFGAPEDARMDLTLRELTDVTRTAEAVQAFCARRGIDPRRAYCASMCMEEMAGNVLSHGFLKDKKKHTVDVRVVHKDDQVILRIKDDCVAFNPAERLAIVDPQDPCKNIGIRMTYHIARDITYQNLLGLNVLTIRI